MHEANRALSGTGTGIVSISLCLSALKVIQLEEKPHEGRLFATALGRPPVPLLYATLTKACSICDPTSLSQHNFRTKYFAQHTDTPEPLALNWDDESLQSKSQLQAGGIDRMLYVPSYIWETANLTSGYLGTFFCSTRMVDVRHTTAPFPSILHTLPSLARLNVGCSKVRLVFVSRRYPDRVLDSSSQDSAPSTMFSHRHASRSLAGNHHRKIFE